MIIHLSPMKTIIFIILSTSVSIRFYLILLKPFLQLYNKAIFTLLPVVFVSVSVSVVWFTSSIFQFQTLCFSFLFFVSVNTSKPFSQSDSIRYYFVTDNSEFLLLRLSLLYFCSCELQNLYFPI